MFFLDSTGFFSLVSLTIQCVLAWVFAVLFAMLSPRVTVWLRHWRTAFFALGIGLGAITVRYVGAFQHAPDAWPLGEGQLATRALYGLYLAGKLAFLWFLVGGVMALRGRAFPQCRPPTVAAALLAAAGVGVLMPTVESMLLVQAPLAIAGSGLAASLLRQREAERPEAGRRIVRGVLLLWCLAWVVYGLCIVVVGPLRPDTHSLWVVPLRLNSLIDLVLQVALGAGLIVVVLQDAEREAVTALHERDLLREQVRRDEKLRVLSTLVSGVAHEINNPLTAILGYADDLSHESLAVRGEATRVVREQAERCRAIVQRLSVLGRRPALERSAVDVAELVARVVRGFQPQAARLGTRLMVDGPGRSRAAHADPTALEQVLTNLVANALQAAPRGGLVTIRTGGDDERLRLAVEDNGPGVPETLRNRIFDPFWTTKPPGEGTGLGLAVARALVHAHGGEITVDATAAGGARFTIELPWGEAGESASAAAPRTAPDPWHVASAAGVEPSSRRLLVIDDEEVVRATIARHAQSDGWQVLAVASAEAALGLLDRKEPVDAVICDLRMPGMSGAGFHDRLRAQAPDLLRRAVFVTGDLASAEAIDFAARCTAPIVVKPFSFPDLFARLRAIERNP